MPNVAENVLEQIGQKALCMIGALKEPIIGDDNWVRLSIGRNAKKVNTIEITLTPKDTYTVTAKKVRLNRNTFEFSTEVISEETDILVDDLRQSIERQTGLRTSL